jgi:phage N-6-adenine-methyltransferase
MPITDNAGMFSSKTPEWETPQSLFDVLHEKHHFTLDAAASRENAKCPAYYTVTDDALKKPWTGTVWCNPPYGREIGNFVEKGYNAAWLGEADKVVMLLPARTDTRWWSDFVMKADEIAFIRGRLKFGGSTNSAPFPSAIVVFDSCATAMIAPDSWYPYVYTFEAPK